ncbi:MAG TPA: MATE family efflux transporter [Clostridiaceae bacterium]|nr:MATE family efflux transporter [Clostridiaceae bacterium]
MPKAKTVFKNRADELGTGPIKSLIWRLSLPQIIAQIINILYNIVDRMYVGHIPETGTLALTGLGVSAPMVMLVASFSAFVLGGGAPLSAIFLGKKESKKAEKVVGTSFILLIVLGAFLMLVGFILKEPLLYLFGASDRTYPFANEYTTWYLTGTIFVMFSLGLNSFITAQGKARVAMFSVLIGAITNIVLDPIFIFLFNLGVKGAAIATVISQAVSAIFIIRFLTSRNSELKLRSKYFRLRPKLVKRILLNGSGTFIMMSTESAIALVFNRGLLHYGSDIHVGVMTIMQSVMQLLMMPVNGFSMGVQPLISYNYGAENKDRVRETIKRALIIMGSVIIAYGLLVQLVPGLFARIFTSDLHLIQLVEHLMPIYMMGIFLMGLQLTAQMTFVATGQAGKSIFLAMLRKVIVLIPLAIILPHFMGVTGVITAEPIADFTSASISGLMLAWWIKKYGKQ